jgi:hypothetical protein
VKHDRTIWSCDAACCEAEVEHVNWQRPDGWITLWFDAPANEDNERHFCCLEHVSDWASQQAQKRNAAEHQTLEPPLPVPGVA